MRELYIVCEGNTEQRFCRTVLTPYLFPLHDGVVHAMRVAFSKNGGVVHRGGLRSYQVMRNDIVRTLNSIHRDGVYLTTMFDLYGLPADFPDKDTHRRDPDNPRPFVEGLELAFANDINDHRFIPHLHLHEFETLLFANLDYFETFYPDSAKQIAKLKKIADRFATAEHINDGPSTAPSKRIIAEFPAYAGQKVAAGPRIVAEIGLAAVRKNCPHFSDWIARLESTLDSTKGDGV